MRDILDTKLKLRFSGVMFVILAYGLGSLAIDSGSYWHYLGAFVFLVWGIKFLVRARTHYHKK